MKTLRAYFSSSFPRLLGLWLAIFLAAPLLNAPVGILTKTTRRVIEASSFEGLAEGKLLVALALRTVVVHFFHRVLNRTITVDESEADWGRKLSTLLPVQS